MEKEDELFIMSVFLRIGKRRKKVQTESCLHFLTLYLELYLKSPIFEATFLWISVFGNLSFEVGSFLHQPLFVYRFGGYSHSIVEGGFEEMS